MKEDFRMFIAMNRFRVAKGSEAAFEHVWLSRDSHLDKVPGFVEFHLLKGPEAEDHTLYPPRQSCAGCPSQSRIFHRKGRRRKCLEEAPRRRDRSRRRGAGGAVRF
jgi:Antibiotic biosynthesis monooxygenase